MLAKWNPFNELVRFERDINSLFNFGHDYPMDIYEDDEKITIEVELPGIDMKEVSITIDDKMMVISGEKKVKKNNKKQYLKNERSEGVFKRAIILPSKADADKIDAVYKDGILTINVPKISKKYIKKIEIKGTS